MVVGAVLLIITSLEMLGWVFLVFAMTTSTVTMTPAAQAAGEVVWFVAPVCLLQLSYLPAQSAIIISNQPSVKVVLITF